MNDEKRRLRELKRDIKKTGNRRRRRFLKQLDQEPDDFDFGLDRSDTMNEKTTRPKRRYRNDASDG